MHTLAGHAQAVFCVDMDKEATTVISGSADRVGDQNDLTGLAVDHCLKGFAAKACIVMVSISPDGIFPVAFAHREMVSYNLEQQKYQL